MICEPKIDDTDFSEGTKIFWALHGNFNCMGAEFCSVVVITLASHARGHRFEPGMNYNSYSPNLKGFVVYMNVGKV